MCAACALQAEGAQSSLGHLAQAFSVEEARAAELETMGPRPNALDGAPVESKLVLHADRNVEIGIWEVTPGTFPASKDDVGELMQFISGAGTITDDDGVTEIEPGVVMYTPDGWTGVWTVRETVRKTYAVHRTKARWRHGLRVVVRRLGR